MITDAWLRSKTKLHDQWATNTTGQRSAGRLVARITPKGERLFYFRYTDDSHKQVRLPIGCYDATGVEGLTLRQARERAGALAKLYQSGVHDVRGHIAREERERKEMDEAAARARTAADAAARAGSLKRLLEAYIAYLVSQQKASAKDVRRLLSLHVFKAFAPLCERRAAELGSRDLRPILAKLVEAGKGRTAAKVRSYIRAAYAIALRAEADPTVPAAFSDFRVEVNPAAALPALSQFNRAGERTLSESELRHYLLAIEGIESVVVRSALCLSLYLGAQRASQLLRVGSMDLDLDGAIVRLRDGKGRRSQPRLHELPLVGEAIEMFRALSNRPRESDFLFTNDGVKCCTVDTVSKAVAAISSALLEAKLISAPFTLRDIRRTCETHLARLGVSKEIRGQIQSHGLGGVQARHYDRHDYMIEKRAALEGWARFLESLRNANWQPTNIVEFRRQQAA